MRATQRLTADITRSYAAFCMLWTDIKHSLQNGMELEVRIQKAKRTLPCLLFSIQH